MNRLNTYAYDVTSQWGEDGIIEEIFCRIGEGTKTCVEFGAYDARFCSNTWNLWFNKDWKALLIEGDKDRIVRLKKYISTHPRVTAVESFVANKGANTIDMIIQRTWKNEVIDLMSIDIDGDDYYILRSIHDYKPRVLVIEYNPTIPPHLDIVQSEGQYFGSSALAMTNLASSMGYKLVEMCGTNCIYVLSEEYSKIYNKEYTVDELFPKEFLTYVISSYSGYSFLSRRPAYDTPVKRLNKPSVTSKNELVPIGNVCPQKRPGIVIRLRKKIGSIYRTLQRRIFKKLAATQDYKISTMRSYASRYDLRIFIETGTYLGGTIDDLKMDFDKLISIELNKKLFESAQEKFKRFPHIQLINGDSGEKLQTIMKTVQQPSLFWLDGHYSGGITSKGNLETPIMKELNSIISHPFNHVILIDDARCFDGTNDYPTIDNLRHYLKNTRYFLSVAGDIIRIHTHA